MTGIPHGYGQSPSAFAASLQAGSATGGAVTGGAVTGGAVTGGAVTGDNRGYRRRWKRPGRNRLLSLVIVLEGREFHIRVAQLFAQLGRCTCDTHRVDVSRPASARRC